MAKSASSAGTTGPYAFTRASPCTATPAATSARSALGRKVAAAVGVHQQRLDRVAHRRPLGLGVEQDVQGHLLIRRRVDVQVAVADPGLDHRHLAAPDHGLDQTGAAARDQHVDQAAGGHQLAGHLTRTRHQLDRVGRQSGVGQTGLQRLDDRRVGLGRRRGAAEQDGVAGLQADAGGVGRHVRPGLVDDAHHAERHPDLADLHPVGVGPPADDVADRVGQGGQRRGGRRPCPAIRSGLSRSRSISALPVPAASARAMSAALASSTAVSALPSASAMACSPASLSDLVARLSSTAARRARLACSSTVTRHPI